MLVRPVDGAVLVLGGSAATVWLELEHPITGRELLARLHLVVPDAPVDSLERELDDAVSLLDREGLLVR